MTVELRATVKRITFSNEDTGFCVVRALVDADVGSLKTEATIVGVMPGLHDGLAIAVEGRWESSTKFGKQFRAEYYRVIPPTTRRGIEAYLASGVIPGVGKTMASRLIEAFGTQVFQVIEKHPNRLTEVSGIGVRRAREIRRAWEKQRGVQEVMVFLASHGVSGSLAGRVFRAYGGDAVTVLRSNPYRLADEVHGVGFQTADKIASEVGIQGNAPARIKAAILFVLSNGVSEGHTFLPRMELLERCESLIGVPSHEVGEVLPDLVAGARIVCEGDGEHGDIVYPIVLHQAESDLAKKIVSVSTVETGPAKGEIDDWVSHVERELDIRLADQQRKAIHLAMARHLLVITGGPGTGKTTLIRAIFLGFLKQGFRVALCAPTGRAARRLGEATGGEAKTIHRLLEFSPRTGEFERCAEHPLSADAVIVDEASMMDISLANALIQSIAEGARLVVVGDADQLPPVGPGSFLRDLIESNCCDVVRLSRVFRQGNTSAIVENAHRINAGEPLDLESREGQDFFFIAREDPEHVLHTLKHLIQERIPKAFNIRSLNDVQVLTPMVRGDLGARHLNRCLQGWLNEQGPSLERGDRIFREGDKVMQIRNNYDKEVFNGDVGFIRTLDVPARSVEVRFDDRLVSYETDELDELVLAYAVTVHKSQGSEYPVVILPMHGQHFMLLRRNLLYTAVTRGKRLVIIIGSERALRMAIERNDMNRRHSKLKERVQQVVQGGGQWKN